MLSKEQNELLTRVSKGTPMGTMMRRYWHPFALSRELPKPDSDPMRVRLLGEHFVAFRDTEGKVGLIDELCLHRGASMALGRVEEGGIRCLYHGWKFAVDGTLMETPNHADPRVKERLKASAYPVREQAGLLWTYIGPKEQEPPFRTFAFDQVPDANRISFRLNVHANYLQMWEGGTDSSHVGILHSNVTRPGWLEESNRESSDDDITDMINEAWNDSSPKLDIENTSFGFHYAGIRRLGPDAGALSNARLVPLFMPNGRIIEFPDFYTTVFDVPVDDERTMSFLVDASDVRPLDLANRIKRSGLQEERYYKDGQFMASFEHGFYQDREAMRAKQSWSGFHGITQEDAVISTSMGPIYDRSTEHLVAADAAIVRLRQRLLDAVRMSEAGEAPLGSQIADMTHMRGFDINLHDGEPWRDHAGHHIEHYAAGSERDTVNTTEFAAAVAQMGAVFDASVLERTRALYAPAVRFVDRIVVERDFAYGPHERHRIDTFVAAQRNAALPVVLFVHGGGFTAGDKHGAPPFYANVGAYFASHGFLAATMNYRLAPDAAWPAGSEDVAAAVDWLASSAARLGGDARRMYLIGQSAGACHVAGYLFDPGLWTRASRSIRAAALMSGFYEALAPLSPGQLAYFGADPTQYDLRSPIRHVAGSAVPLLLTLAQFDPPALACQTLQLAGELTRARGRCPPLTWLEGHNHVSSVMSLGTCQDDAGRLLIDFFNKEFPL